MFGNNYNGGSQEPSVNTKAITLWGDLSMLNLNYWNTNISFNITPCGPKNAEGKRTYDSDKRVSSSIVPDKALMLYNAIKREILPAIDKYETTGVFDGELSVGFDVGKTKTSGIFVEYKYDENNIPTTYLSFYKEIDAESNVAGENYSYKFNKQRSIIGYNPSTGSGDVKLSESEFLVFVQILKSVTNLLGTAYHVNKYYEATSLNNASYSKNKKSGGNSYNAPIESGSSLSLDDMDDLPF